MKHERKKTNKTIKTLNSPSAGTVAIPYRPPGRKVKRCQRFGNIALERIALVGKIGKTSSRRGNVT